jgi:hypothetical protein
MYMYPSSAAPKMYLGRIVMYLTHVEIHRRLCCRAGKLYSHNRSFSWRHHVRIVDFEPLMKDLPLTLPHHQPS